MSKQQKSAQGSTPITDEPKIPATAFRVSDEPPPYQEDFAGTAGKPANAMHREIDRDVRKTIDESLKQFPPEKVDAYSKAPMLVSWDVPKQVLENIQAGEWLSQKAKRGEYNPKTRELIEDPADVPAGSTVTSIKFRKPEQELEYYKVKQKLHQARLQATRNNLLQLRLLGKLCDEMHF
jgi:hypothetical protein